MHDFAPSPRRGGYVTSSQYQCWYFRCEEEVKESYLQAYLVTILLGRIRDDAEISGRRQMILVHDHRELTPNIKNGCRPRFRTAMISIGGQ